MGEMAECILDIKRRWQEGRFFTQGVALSEEELQRFMALPEVVYQIYMRARIFRAAAGEIGELLITLPPGLNEDNYLHIHPISDRDITIVQGAGFFIAQRQGKFVVKILRKGDRIVVPRGVLHTCLSGSEGLIIKSLHIPWVPPDDSRCSFYPSEKISPQNVIAGSYDSFSSETDL